MAAVRRSDAATAYTVQLTRVGIETHWIHNFRELQVPQRQSPCVTLAKLSSPRERVLSTCVDYSSASGGGTVLRGCAHR